MRVAVSTTKAPAVPANLMNQGIVANGFVFTSGAVGKDPVTGDMVKGPVEARAVSPDSHPSLSCANLFFESVAPLHPEPSRHSRGRRVQR